MRSVIVIFLVMFMMNSLLAQDRGTREDRTRFALSQLDLTPLQKNKLEHLKTKYKDLFEHNVRSTPDRRARMEKRKTLQRDLRLEMQNILTPSQQQKFRDIMMDDDPKAGGRMLMETLAALDLTKDQKMQIRTLLEDQRPKMEALRKAEIPEEAKRAKLREIRQQTNAGLRKILTKEQFDALEHRPRPNNQRKRKP